MTYNKYLIISQLYIHYHLQSWPVTGQHAAVHATWLQLVSFANLAYEQQHSIRMHDTGVSIR